MLACLRVCVFVFYVRAFFFSIRIDRADWLRKNETRQSLQFNKKNAQQLKGMDSLECQRDSGVQA